MDSERIVGVVSERDIVWGFAKHGTDTTGMTVGQLMSPNAITCRPDDSVRTVMARMTQSRVRHLPVSENRRLVGIISIDDGVKHRLGELETETHVLRDAYIAHR